MAVLWGIKQALRSCIAKGSLHNALILLTGAGGVSGLSPFKPTGLAPQKVAETDGGDATRDTYQRKVFYDGTNFFVLYWNSGDKKVYYIASEDGETWSTPVVLVTFSVAPYFGGNFDLQYPNRGTKDWLNRSYDLSLGFSGSNGVTWNWRCYTISGQTWTGVSSASVGGNKNQGGSLGVSVGASYEVWVNHHLSYIAIGCWATIRSQSTEVSHGDTTTGGAQIIPCTSLSFMILAKGGDDKLYYNLAPNDAYSWLGSFSAIATLGTGFSDFCACSEAQVAGDPERVHLVYIKSTGELCYNKFENDEWGVEKVLVASDASYPVIACGASGKLYVFYIKDGVIWVIHYDGSKWFAAVKLYPEHTYTNPTYLSTNQNAQSDKICLVWTEGASSPYSVHFCYLED